MNKLFKPNEIGIFALGGLGEIGKNMYVIEYLEQIFIIDAGLLFPDEHLLGIDCVIQDYQYLIENQDKIVGLFITHGHEDHIGGIPYLLKKVRIPKIYASGIAVALIEDKLSEQLGGQAPTMVEYKSHYKYPFNGVELSFVRLNHSIPDSFAFVFKTSLGTIIHSGDFKFDFTPLGPSAEYEKLANLGAEGVLCLLADSTNALVDGFTISEKKVFSTLRDLFDHINGRILVATFASNIYRIQQIVEASVLYNRKVAVFGRSMEKTIEIGQEAGYIKAKKGTFITSEEISNYPAKQITILCTGSQGEPLAALSRIANGTHKQIKQMPGDTVIFSSSPIPGNNVGINKTINQLFKNGVNVITNSPLNDIHTSGHAACGELKLMQALVKPKYFMPIHGEYRMLMAHTNLAIECGVKPENTFVMENGNVLVFNKEGAHIAGNVPAGDVYVDGSNVGDIGGMILKERKFLSDEGMMSIAVTINLRTKTLVLDPTIISRGFIYMKTNEDLTNQIASLTCDIVNNELGRNATVASIKNAITAGVNKLIIERTSRNPLIIPIVMTV